METLTMEDIDEKIIKGKLELLKTLGKPKALSVRLKARLEEMGVITPDLTDQMETSGTTPNERLGYLVDDLRRGPTWRFLHFCRVMHEEGKPDVLEALEVDIDYVKDQLDLVEAEGDLPPEYQWKDDTFPTESPAEYSLIQRLLGFFSNFIVWFLNLLRPGLMQPRRLPQKCHFYRLRESDEKRAIPAPMLEALLQHCEAMERSLMRTPLFDFDEDGSLDLSELYVSTDVWVKQNEREQTQIAVEEFFLPQFQNNAPNTLLLEGEAGSGKSSLLRHYAHSVCKQLLGCHNKGPGTPCEGHVWRLVVYTAAGRTNGTAKQAIKNNLMCNPQLKRRLMNAISKDGEGVLVLKDGMDELHDPRSVKNIRDYTNDCQKMVGKPKLLLSSRTGLSQVEKVLFDRVVRIEGFSVEQGLRYVETYFRVRYNLTQHPVLTHIQAHTGDVEWVLRNPLQALVFSELTARGELTVQDIGSLSPVKLLKVFETHVIRRDAERRQADKTPGCASRFYNACLNCLLKDKRRLTENDVEHTSPHMAFLHKYKHTDIYANTEIYFMFGHEMFLEFFSIQGLIQCLKANSPTKQAMLLYLCANSKMRNALLLTCGYIAEYERGLFPDLVFIVQACLVLQVEEQRCVMNQLTDGLLQLPAVIHNTFPPAVFTEGLTTEQARTAEEVSRRIQRAFNQDAGLLREAAWFLNGYLFAGEAKFYYQHYKFIMGCVRQCPADKQADICSRTTHQLLPCVRLSLTDGAGQDEAVFPVSGARWGALRCSGKDGSTLTQVSVWCPRDLTSTLTQYDALTRHTSRTAPCNMTVYLHDHGSLWGPQPPEVLTRGDWEPALRHVLAYRVTDLTIFTDHVSRTSPLDGLLTALQGVVTAAHSLTGEVTVYHGQMSAEVLEDFCEWAETVSLGGVVLWNSTVVLGAGCGEWDVTHGEWDVTRGERDVTRGERDVTRLHQRVQDVVRGAVYVTQDGQRVTHPGHPDNSGGDEIDDLDTYLRSLGSNEKKGK